ncbi:MAG: beta strand repeat-containing protein [Acidobacteriaceae bacterium]
MSRFTRRFASTSPLRLGSMTLAAATFVCVLAFPGSALAQAFYQSGTSSYTTGGTPQGVAVVDLNRDGKPDSITANGTSNQISVLLSNNTGYAVATVGTGSGTDPVAVGVLPDFARSGLPAVAVVEQGTSEVAIYTDSTSGALTLDTTYGTGAAPTAIVVGDFNNDGIPDMAVAYSTGVTVLLGSENGAFTSGGGVAVGTKLSAIAVGYFSDARDADLAVTDQTGATVYILKGAGNGSFSETSSYATGTTPESIGVADFNHDGKEDIVVGNYGGASVSLYLGNGNDTFGAQTAYPAGGNVQGLVVTDVNNDGNADVVVTNPPVGTTGETLGVLIGTGTGSFNPVLNPALGGSPYGIATLDFNRDGRPDVAVTQSSGLVSVLTNNTLLDALPGGRNFLAATQMGPGNMADAVATADFNGDGLPDVAVAYLEDGKVGVMLGNGNGTFGAQTLYSVGKHPYSIAVGDLNHDGSPDIVVANETDGTVSVLLNNGSGGFGTASTYTVGRLPTGVAIGDLNGDGFPDLAVTNYGGNDVSILINSGTGTFTPGSTPTLAAGTNPYNVAIADFRGDGKNDVAITNFKSSDAEVYLGNGDGSFQSPTTFTIPSLPGGGGVAPVGGIEPSSIAVGDFNRDGNLDFAVGTAAGNTIAIFLGNGSGGFTSSAIQTLNFPVSIAVGDVNGDGIPDIVNVNPNFNNVSVLLGKGDGTFSSRWQFPTAATTAPNTVGAQPWAVALADFNQDGKLDIVTANTVARINLTMPAYQPAPGAVLSPASPNSTSVLLNSSGTSNVVTVSPNGNNVPYNSSVTLSAKITPALGGVTATGSVLFEDTNGSPASNTPVPLAGGQGSVTLQNLGSGTHIISGLYSGDVNYQPNTTVAGGQQVVVVNGTPVTLTLNPNTMPYQGTFTATITVTGTAAGGNPTGSLNLYIYFPGTGYEYATTGQPFPLGNGDCSNYVCTYSVTISDPGGYLTPGTWLFYAVYNPNNSNYQSGASPNEGLTVTPATPDITLDCALATGGGSEVCYSEVTNPVNGNAPIQTGYVTFSLNGGAAQSEPIQYQTVQTAAGNTTGYYAVQTYSLIPGFFTETATFPAGQGGGTLGGATITGSFCSSGCGPGAAARRSAFSSLRGAVPLNLASPDHLSLSRRAAWNNARRLRWTPNAHQVTIMPKGGSPSGPGGGGVTIGPGGGPGSGPGGGGVTIGPGGGPRSGPGGGGLTIGPGAGPRIETWRQYSH